MTPVELFLIVSTACMSIEHTTFTIPTPHFTRWDNGRKEYCFENVHDSLTPKVRKGETAYKVVPVNCKHEWTEFVAFMLTVSTKSFGKSDSDEDLTYRICTVCGKFQKLKYEKKWMDNP